MKKKHVYIDNIKLLYVINDRKWKTGKKGKFTLKLVGEGESGWFNGKEREIWLYKNKLHREDGPALLVDETWPFWFLDGEEYLEEEWKFEIRKRKLEKLGI